MKEYFLDKKKKMILELFILDNIRHYKSLYGNIINVDIVPLPQIEMYITYTDNTPHKTYNKRILVILNNNENYSILDTKVDTPFIELLNGLLAEFKTSLLEDKINEVLNES